MRQHTRERLKSMIANDWGAADWRLGESIHMSDEPGEVFVCQKSCNILNRANDMVVQLKNGFHGLNAFGEVFDYMPPIGTVDRIVFDFSTAGNTETNELFSMLIEIAANERFSGMEISIEGLNWDKLDKHPT